MRVVLVRLSAVGDIVHTWPLAEALRAACPRMHLTWVVEEPLRTLVDGHPAVDAVITVATRRWRKRPLSARTRAEFAIVRGRFAELVPELAIDPQGVLKSALVTRATRASRRVGLARPWRRELVAGMAYTETIPGSSTDPHVVATNMALVRALGADPPTVLPAPDGTWMIGEARNPDLEGTAVLLPGAGDPTKVLPVATLAEVARQLSRLGLRPLLVWGPSERERAARVVEAAGRPSRLAAQTDLLDLAGLLGSSSLVVGADTGPVHLAASLGTPTVAMFVCTSPRRNRPLGDRVVVVSGVREGEGSPASSARAAPTRSIEPEEIVDGARTAIGSG